MLKKDAIKQAISTLSAIPGNEDVVSVLQQLLEDEHLLFSCEEDFHEYVRSFKKRYSKYPTTNDFKKPEYLHNKELPSYYRVQNTLGCTPSQWLRKNGYIESREKEDLKQRHTEAFIKEYERIKPNCEYYYNEHRDKSAPTSKTIRSYYNMMTFAELVKTLELQPYNRAYINIKKKRKTTKFTISVKSDVDGLIDFLCDNYGYDKNFDKFEK